MNQEEKQKISEEAKKAKVKMVGIGQTGDGKSSLCNYIINCKDKFNVSSDPDSGTKTTVGALAEDKNVYIIDTPGLQDSHGTDLENLIQMVEYIKTIKELNAVIIIFNLYQPRLPIYVNTMIKLFNDIFSVKDFWEHVAIVFTKCYYYMPEDERKEMEESANKTIKKIQDIIRETGKNYNVENLPKFMIDSNMKEKAIKNNKLLRVDSSLTPVLGGSTSTGGTSPPLPGS